MTKHLKTLVLFSGMLAFAACSSKTEQSGDSSSSAGSNKDNVELSASEIIDNKSTAENPTANLNKEYPVITFEKPLHNFGDIIDGEKVRYKYKFKNTGKADLLINNCEVSCGCTTPSYPKTPVKPGEGGEIEVIFDSSGKSGASSGLHIQKYVKVHTNAKDSPATIEFEATVYPPAKTN